jgi:acetylornithine/succinyldiaminopimelate/putrescine aminotransferase
MATARPVIREVRGKGLLIGAELSRPAAPVVDACREAGLLILSAGEKVMRLAPPLVVDERLCDEALAILDRALARLS